jgi:hypothetical protein
VPETPATLRDSRASAGLPVRIMEVGVCVGRDDGGAVCAGEENGLFGLEVRESGRVVRGGETYVGLIMGISRALSVFTRDGLPKCVYVWYGLDFGKYSDSQCRASGRRCRLCVLGVGGLALVVMSVLAGKRGRQAWDHGVLSSGQSACLIL